MFILLYFIGKHVWDVQKSHSLFFPQRFTQSCDYLTKELLWYKNFILWREKKNRLGEGIFPQFDFSSFGEEISLVLFLFLKYPNSKRERHMILLYAIPNNYPGFPESVFPVSGVGNSIWRCSNLLRVTASEIVPYYVPLGKFQPKSQQQTLCFKQRLDDKWLGARR